MEYDDWIKNSPNQFPKNMAGAEYATTFKNPVIGETQQQTDENIIALLELVMDMTLPACPQRMSLTLDEQKTAGFITLLQCAIGAMQFEKSTGQRAAYH